MTIKERINLALERAGKSQRDLAKAMGKSSPAVSEMLSKPGDLDSLAYVEATSALTGIPFEAIRTGIGFDNAVVNEIKTEYNKSSSMNLAEFYQELVESRSDYRLVPKAIIDGDYRIVLKSEIDEMNKIRERLIEAKDKSISLLENRIVELERMISVSQHVKK